MAAGPGVPETRYARAPDGTHIAYQVVGDGPVDLAFFPTPFSHLEARWEDPSHARFLRQLASFSRLIIFDKRGFGLSDRGTELSTLDLQMDDVLAVLDAAGSRSCAAYGFLDGAALAAVFSATYPERVASLVLYAAGVRMVRGTGYPWGFTERDLELVLEEVNDGFRFDTLLGLLAPSRAGDPALTQMFARLARLSAGPATIAHMIRLMTHTDIRAVLPAIQAATLVIARTHDTLFPPSHGRHVADQIPNASYVEIAGSDTGVWGRDFDLLADEIEKFVVGGQAVQRPERVLATVLFTDIVGSTASAADIGDRHWRELLDTHHKIVGSETARHRGLVIKTTGDGVLATFDGPGRAIRCAQSIADVMRPLGIDIRAGLHTGEIELIDGDIGGIAVHIAARVMNEAGPNEVLVSSSVPPLVAGSGFTFSDRGEHQLKGVPDTWRLFAVDS